MSEPLELDELNIDDLNELLEVYETRQAELTQLAGQATSWKDLQSNSLIGRVLQHVESQLDIANQDLAQQTAEVDVLIPEEETRVNLRKSFHSTLLSAFKFSFCILFLFLLIPAILEFLDGLAFSTPLSLGIYPLLGVAIPSIVLIIMLVLRSKYHKEVWPTRRILKYVLLSTLTGALVGTWPLVGPLVHLFVASTFFPSFLQVFSFALLWLLIVFTGAILKYHAGFREYYDSVTLAHAILAWASRGSLHIRTSIHRLNQISRQVTYWAEMLGLHLRKPWITNPHGEMDEGWAKSVGSFPPSIKVAEAIDQSPDGGPRPIAIERIIHRIALRESSRGWRKENFRNLLATAAKFSPSGLNFGDAIDRDTPASPNGSRAEVLKLVQNERFLAFLGDGLHDGIQSEVQDWILDEADLPVSVVQPGRRQDKNPSWDEHLVSVIGDVQAGSPPLANFAIQELHHQRGYANGVTSFVFAPSRVIRLLETENAGREIPAGLNLKALSSNSTRNIDLVLRLDIAGIEQQIDASHLHLPVVGSPERTSIIAKDACQKCGRRTCASLDGKSACDGSAV